MAADKGKPKKEAYTSLSGTVHWEAIMKGKRREITLALEDIAGHKDAVALGKVSLLVQVVEHRSENDKEPPRKWRTPHHANLSAVVSEELETAFKALLARLNPAAGQGVKVPVKVIGYLNVEKSTFKVSGLVLLKV